MQPINPTYTRTFPPPVMEARRWIEGRTFAPDRPLINLSQAAPRRPPARAAGPRHGRGRCLTDPALASSTARSWACPTCATSWPAQWSAAYGGTIRPAQVAVTAGCNQAFTAVMSTLAGAGDEVILPLPFYFNHKMWLDMEGVRSVHLPTGDDLLPDPDRAAALITDRTRAIVLISPNNPAGVEYPAELLRAFFELARTRGIALVLDETYRDFHSGEGAPHDLFTDPDWHDTLIHLYSFSKAYRLTGHRVGALMASEARLAEVEKFLDTVAICAPQIGQIGALWGMRNLRGWLAGERAEILARRDALTAGFQRLPDWRLLGCGAYFAYVAHPFARPSDMVAREMVEAAALLTLPGTMFGPTLAHGGTGQAERTLRIAFANADAAGLTEVVDRLAALDL